MRSPPSLFVFLHRSTLPSLFAVRRSRSHIWPNRIPGYGEEIRNVVVMHIMNAENRLAASFVAELRNERFISPAAQFRRTWMKKKVIFKFRPFTTCCHSHNGSASWRRRPVLLLISAWFPPLLASRGDANLFQVIMCAHNDLKDSRQTQHHDGSAKNAQHP